LHNGLKRTRYLPPFHKNRVEYGVVLKQRPMTLTAIAMINFISLSQIAEKLNKTIEEVEADVEEFGIPLYRNNGNYGLTVEDTESYLANLFAIKQKEILESIYSCNSIGSSTAIPLDEPLLLETKPEAESPGLFPQRTVASSAFPSVYSFICRRKTDTKECLRDTLKNLGNYSYYLQSLVVSDPGSQEFINALATELKHHKSKSIDSKVAEIKKAILELWAEA
jgi:hypothetical protein